MGLASRVRHLEQQLTEAEQTIHVMLGAMEELTLQTQFLLRTITDTKEVVGLLDVKPRKITVRLLDVYRKRRFAIAQELANERKAIEEAQARDEARLLAALQEAGIDPNDHNAVDQFVAERESTAEPEPSVTPSAG